MTIVAPEDLIIRPIVAEVLPFSEARQRAVAGAYRTQLVHCTCPDFFYRDKPDHVHLCKHIVGVYEFLSSWHVAEDGDDELIYRLLVVEVRSLTDLNLSYAVHLAHCTCLDFLYRDKPGEMHLCKHIRRLHAARASWRPVAAVTA